MNQQNQQVQNQSPQEMLLQLYQKPMNQKYQEQILNDSSLQHANEKYTQLYTKFDVKNFDIRTDGTPVQYKPEYH